MRNYSQNAAQNRKVVGGAGSSGGSGGPPTLAGPNQSRYKGIITSSPGTVKFSAWKRENDIPKQYFHEFLLQKIKEKDPNKVWLKDATMGRVETFGRVASSVAKVASGLTKLGFKQKDVVCMWCSNYVEYWILALAAWSCGGCVMPVNCEMEVEQLEEQLMDSGAKFLVCDDYNYCDGVDIMDSLESLQHVIVVGSEGKGSGCIPVSDLLEDDGKAPPGRINISMDSDPAYLPYTSSTNGVQKGIIHTHKSLMAQIYSPDNTHNHYIDQMYGDSIACGNYFFHMSGFYPVALSACYGITVYTLSEYTDTTFLEMIVENKIATATLYPWQIRLLSQSPSITKYDLACLKSIITSMGVLSSTIRAELLDRFPNVKFVREAYGLNECGLVTLTYPREKKNSVSAGKSVMETPDDHVMAVGLPNMYTQIKIINRLSNEPVGGPDEQGEICIKGPQSFVGYYKEDNSNIFDSEGFFHTGDLGYFDSQGVIYFIERKNNLIQFWMYEVAPNILEARLLCSNNIVDAAVVGIPDKENGEVPRAFVVLRPGFEETEENLTNLIESRLQDHERIRGGLYFVESIPRDENWNVMKDVLKDYQPLTTEESNEKLASEESEGATSSSKILAETIGKSPKLAKKVVKELSKQPNGSYKIENVEENSRCRTKKVGGGSEAAASTLSPPPTEAQDVFMGRNRSRRGSMNCILEDESTASGSQHQSTLPHPSSSLSARRASKDPSYSRSSSRRSSIDAGATILSAIRSSSDGSKNLEGTFSFWMKVHVYPPALEAVIMTHPAVDDCSVLGHFIDGIGHLPRAYVVLKNGYVATGDEILSFAHVRLAETDRIRGGIVFVDKLAKDPSGKLLINIEKFTQEVVCMDKKFIDIQPRIQISTIFHEKPQKKK